MEGFKIFVYGSLKRGERNFAAYCRGFQAVAAATVVGQLFRQPDGYPMLVVPAAHVLAVGTNDPAFDVETLAEIEADELQQEAEGADWEQITGEIFSFGDPEVRLPRIDELEEFVPGGNSLYHRVIVPAMHAVIEPVWTYVAPEGRVPPGSARMGTSWSS